MKALLGMLFLKNTAATMYYFTMKFTISIKNTTQSIKTVAKNRSTGVFCLQLTNY